MIVDNRDITVIQMYTAFLTWTTLQLWCLIFLLLGLHLILHEIHVDYAFAPVRRWRLLFRLSRRLDLCLFWSLVLRCLLLLLDLELSWLPGWTLLLRWVNPWII